MNAGFTSTLYMNTEVIVHPRLQHLGFTTGKVDEMVMWYRSVLGVRVIYRSENPTGTPEAGFRPTAVWLTNDEANYRIAIVGISNFPSYDRHHPHARIQHAAFSFTTLDELLGTFTRLSRLGITPVMAADEGAQTALYFQDPDGNTIELNASNYGDPWTSAEHMTTSPDFAEKPMGVYIDPQQMIAMREQGAAPWELHERAWNGEFAPKTPYDYMAML